jgi:hypothetical protein
MPSLINRYVSSSRLVIKSNYVVILRKSTCPRCETSDALKTDYTFRCRYISIV